VEERLARLEAAAGKRTARGAGAKAEKKKAAGAAAKGGAPGQPQPGNMAPEDWAGETVFYEGPPSRGDLAVNVALAATVLWIPLTLAAVGRAIWVKYKFTDKRISITSTSPLNSEQTDVSYKRVEKCVAIGRGVGLWGDMVVTLDDGSKLEFRALDQFQEIRDYILQRAEEEKEAETARRTGEARPARAASPKGF